MVLGNPLTLGGGGGGFSVTVHHCGVNAIVTARHGTKQETARADAGGVAVFEKLDKGVWFFTSPNRENAIAEILGKTDLDFDAEVFNPSPNGLIICTAPIGSTVTANNGTQTFKADKTLMGDNEIHTISIKPEYFSENPITVICVKADETSTTQEAVVDSKEDVELNFALLWLYRNGNEYTEITGGWNVYGSSVKYNTYMIVGVPSTVTAEKSGIAKTKNKISVGQYKKLCCEFTDVTNSVVCGITTNASTNAKALQQSASIAQASIAETVSHTILEVVIPDDIDDVYIWVGEYTTSKKRSGTLVSVWLE